MAVLAASVLVPAWAEAQPEAPPVRLSWVRGPGAHACSSPQQIADQVVARLGRSLFAADAARSIDAYLTRGERGWRAEIFVRGRDGALAGSRELTSEAADCAPIEAASVLALALAIDPDAITRPMGAAPAPPSPAPAPRGADRRGDGDGGGDRVGERIPLSEPLPAWVPPPPERGPSAGVASGAALRAGVGLGLLPRVAAAVSLAAQVAVGRAAQITGGALWMPEVRAADPRFAFGLTAFALGACVDIVQRPRVDLAACGALWGGALHAVVLGLPAIDPGQHPWAGVEASPRLRLRLVAHVHAELGAQVVVPLVRAPFTVTGWAAPVFQQAPATLLPFAGLGASFP